MLTCTRCALEKPESEFYLKSNSKWCKACHRETSKAWREQNPDKAKETRQRYLDKNPAKHRQDALRRMYGLELADYDRLLEAQDGRCWICGSLEPKNKTKQFLCVDHVEGTTEIRGLLCSFCNSAIGYLEHSVELLQQAIAYLEKGTVFVGTKRTQGVQKSREANDDL